MELQVTGKNIEITPAVQHYIERKFGKLNRYFPNITESKVEVIEEKTKSPQQHFIVRITVIASGTRLHGEERGEDLFQAIDKTAATMTRQLEHHKGKLYEKGRGNSFARGGLGEETEMIKTPKVVKVKRFAVKPMPVVEAAEQMELLNHDFFLFFNADTEEINLLYRRKDGNYGLIEPESG